jgi:hypothetical protein
MARMPPAGWNETANQTIFPTSETLGKGMIMFVRAVWRHRRLVDVRPNPREIGAPPRRNVDILGVSRPDFANMTRGLFDRQA